MAKKSTQKFKYLENNVTFLDEIKSIFHHFYRPFIEANQIMFFDGESPILETFNNYTIVITNNIDKIRIL